MDGKMENTIVLQLLTINDNIRRAKERKEMAEAGLLSSDMEAYEERFSKFAMPPVAWQKIVGVYMTSVRKSPSGAPNINTFIAAGDDEAGLVSFAFSVFDTADKRLFQSSNGSGVPHPVVVAGNGGHAMRILLSKACEFAGETLRGEKNGFDIEMHSKNLTRFLNTEDKWGANWLNQWSKTLVDPSNTDSLMSFPVETASERLYAYADWEGLLKLANTAGKKLSERAFTINALSGSFSRGSDMSFWKGAVSSFSKGASIPVAFKVLNDAGNGKPLREKVLWSDVENASPVYEGCETEVF